MYVNLLYAAHRLWSKLVSSTNDSIAEINDHICKLFLPAVDMRITINAAGNDI